MSEHYDGGGFDVGHGYFASWEKNDKNKPTGVVAWIILSPVIIALGSIFILFSPIILIVWIIQTIYGKLKEKEDD